MNLKEGKTNFIGGNRSLNDFLKDINKYNVLSHTE